MTSFNADNRKAVDKPVMSKYGIHMVDNGASVPYTDVVLDCSGSMAADMGGMDRIAFSLNLLKTLHSKGHVNGKTLVHGFDSQYRGCLPLSKIMAEPIYGNQTLVELMFRPGGGTTPGAALNHVTNIGSTLAIMDMWSEGDLKPSLTTPYDCIFYGV